MKQIFIFIFLLATISVSAQTYGGEIRAKNNSLTVDIIKRNGDALKTWDSTTQSTLSTINGKIPSNLTVTSTRLLVDGSGVTQPVSGTVAFSNTTIATTNAGTFAVQESGSALTALQLIDDGIVSQGTALGTTKNYLMGGSVTTAAPTYTTGNINPLSLTTAGALRVDGSGVTQPVSIAATISNNLSQLNGNTVSTGNGVAGTGVLRVAVASDQTAFSVNAIQSGTWNIGTATTVTTVSTVTNLSQMGGQAIAMGTGVRSAGTQRVTIATDDVVPASQSGTWTVQPGNTANTTPWLVSAIPTTSGGLSIDSRTGLTNTVVSAKASAGQLYGYYWYNPNATAAYIQVFNTASGSVTLGTTTPVYVITIPATSGANVEFTNGIAHSTAITYACTTTATGSTAMGSTLTGFMLYK